MTNNFKKTMGWFKFTQTVDKSYLETKTLLDRTAFELKNLVSKQQTLMSLNKIQPIRSAPT